MTRMTERLRTLMFSLTVGGALIFGASTALAATATECPSFAISACNSPSNCQQKCDLRYPGAGLYGACENGCCFCVE